MTIIEVEQLFDHLGHFASLKEETAVPCCMIVVMYSTQSTVLIPRNALKNVFHSEHLFIGLSSHAWEVKKYGTHFNQL
jgi:hypothetical protein